MKILLVDPPHPKGYYAFGLLKISAMLKDKGHEVHFAYGRQELNFIPKEIWITSLFTYYYDDVIKTVLYYKKHFPKSEIKIGGIYASIMPDHVERFTGIKPHFGLLPEAEKYGNDYSLFETDYSFAFTSRGCIRKCPFCFVPKIEGKLQSVENWEKDIDVSKDTIVFMDNNFLAKGIPAIRKDIDKIKDFVKRGVKMVDFRQAIDARVFNEEIAIMLSEIPIRPVRFAFDNMAEDGHCQKAIQLSLKHILKKGTSWYGGGFPNNIMIYVLYNFQDTPQNFYYRITEILKNGGCPYPMQYSPFEDLQRKFIGENWTKTQRDNIKNL